MINVNYIDLLSFDGGENGILNVLEKNLLPFDINRMYTVSNTKENNIRGYHAHKKLWQVFFAINGTIDVCCENNKGEKAIFILDSPKKGLICGPLVWHTLTYHDGAILVVLASDHYNENDYIRDYDEFLKYANTSK